MINGRRILAVVLARGGSKGLPGKNLLPLGGKPMVAWSVIAAGASRLVDRAIVSTDDPAIAEAALAAGGEVPFMRPGELARDEATVHESLIHALRQLGQPFDYLVALQATSPLRTGADIDGAITACDSAGAVTCVSVVPAPKSVYWSFAIGGAGRLEPILESQWQTRRRQELPTVYQPNGAVYVARVDWYRSHLTFVGPDTVPYVMPPERSLEVDSALDMTLISALFTGDSANFSSRLETRPMNELLKGNFQTKTQVTDAPTKQETLEDRFEREAMKRLGGSIAYVSKKKVMWDLKNDKG